MYSLIPFLTTNKFVYMRKLQDLFLEQGEAPQPKLQSTEAV